MFDFRIVDTEDGNQIIDRQSKTPEDILTPLQSIEYIELDSRLFYMDRMERKARAEREREQKFVKNLFLRLAVFWRLA